MRSLSPRQTEILRLAIQGLTNKEIARHMGIEPETVKTQVHVIIAKTGKRRTAWWQLVEPSERLQAATTTGGRL